MNLTRFSLTNRATTLFIATLLSVAGVFSFTTLGQLEDPEFSVKNALIITPYPGANAKEVEQEVTDRIENALQQMPELKSVHSRSTPGSSLINVEIKGEYWSDQLPQIWDKMRRKVNDVQSQLPVGTAPSQVIDDFGDVYGLMLGVLGDGFSYQEMEHHVKILQKELNLIEGVARVDLWGDQQSTIYIDVSQSKLASLGLSLASIGELLQSQNLTVDAGHIETESLRLNVQPTGRFNSSKDIEDLLIYGQSATERNEFITIKDIATVTQGYVEPARTLMRLNAKPAIVLSISPLSGTNVVKMGEQVSAKLEAINGQLPVGIEVEKIHWQPEIVKESVNSFLINFAEAVLIVLVVLTVSMGWRMGIVIGTALALTILGTFVLLAVFNIDLHRMSLGALIIALGMMVDNAIVVAEGYVVKRQQGFDKETAAIESAKGPSLALLGATIIAVMAFYPIFSSIEGAGEYCRTLFIVVATSLLVSWIISLTVTPLQCILLLKNEAKDIEKEGKLLSLFRMFLVSALRRRLLTLLTVILLFVAAIGTFGNVKQIFFPSSAMTKFTVDYWGTEGSRIQATAQGMATIEQYILQDKRVTSTAAFIGQGSPRFYLPVDPENPNPAFGQIIVSVESLEELDDVILQLQHWLDANIPDALTRVRKYSVGPAVAWEFEARFLGPSDADPSVLRGLAEQGMNILRATDIAKETSTDWRQQTLDVIPQYSQIKGRTTGVSLSQVANTTKRYYDGIRVGTYRYLDDQIPIVVREETSNRSINNLEALQIESAISGALVPLGQTTQGISTQWQNSTIWRFNRHRAITVQASPKGVTASELRAAVVDDFEKIELPEGYKLQWFGEHKDTVDSQQSLIPGVVPALAIILFILVALFNSMRPMILILMIIPFVMIGVSFGLQISGAAFGFVALLGVMSLSGMMIKNAIVLIEQINLEKSQGKEPYKALVDSTISRIRPVFLAAATTVLGVIPLVSDVFWQGLAVSIMAGLSFGTLLTMIVLPVLYSMFYRIRT